MTTAAKIKKLRSIEYRATQLQAKLDKMSTQWEELLESVQGTPQWRDNCSQHGLVQNPTWGGVLA